MRKVIEASVTFHGVEHSQYFQGHGISGTKWDACATGIGESYAEAVADAVESLAQCDYEVTGEHFDNVLDLALHSECGRSLARLEEDSGADATDLHSECVVDPETNCDDCELHYFVSIDVKGD